MHAFRSYLRIAIFLMAIIRCVGLYASAWSDTMHIADINACAHIVATDPEAVNGSEQSIIDACITEWGVC